MLTTGPLGQAIAGEVVTDSVDEEQQLQGSLAEGRSGKSRRRAAAVAVALAAPAVLSYVALRSAQQKPQDLPTSFGFSKSIDRGTACMNTDAVYAESVEHTVEDCIRVCEDDDKCSGVMYSRAYDGNDKCAFQAQSFGSFLALPGECLLYSGECSIGHSECWNRVDVKSEALYMASGWGVGCANAEAVKMADSTMEANEAACAQRCVELPGCTGFGFQGADTCGDDERDIGEGACMLYKGPCVHKLKSCWSDFTMTKPTPAQYKLTGAHTWCRNHEEALLAKYPLPLGHELSCSAQCVTHDGCTGFSFMPSGGPHGDSCMGSGAPDFGKSNCILWQHKCIPQPDPCWDMYDSDSPEDYGDLQTPINPLLQPAVSGVDCGDDWRHKMMEPKLNTEKTIEKCALKCYSTAGCQGISYQIATNITGRDVVVESKKGACVLWGSEICLGVSPYWDTHQLTWPTPKIWSTTFTNIACPNYEEILIGAVKMHENPYTCAQKCRATYGCIGHAFQPESCRQANGGVAKGACMLFAGPCDITPGGCWNVYALETSWDENASAPPETSTTTVTSGPEPLPAYSHLMEPAPNGSTELKVRSQEGFIMGYSLWIRGVNVTEGGRIVGLGSGDSPALFLDSPLNHSFKVGAAVIQAGSGPIPTTSTTKDGTTITFTTTKKVNGKPTFINEICSKTTGSSSIVGIEVAGKTATNLGGWTVALYSASGKQISKVTVEDGTTIPNLSTNKPIEHGDFGVKWIPTPATAFAAVALIGKDGKIVEFLSLGSELTAVDGSAEGEAAFDIFKTMKATDRTSEPKDSETYQRKGSGQMAEDFRSWRIAGDSRGLVNGLQNFA